MVRSKSSKPSLISRRRMLQAALAATVAGWELTPFRPLKAAGGPQGLALCIGLNSVDPRKYSGWSGRLAGCIPDMKSMAGIAGANRFYDVKRLADEPSRNQGLAHDVATIANVRRYIAWAANDLQPGDLFLISYSGHGSTRRDTNGDEEDGQDETWCLWDGQWGDDDRFVLWQQFKPGVRILVISDSCHSGTVARVLQTIDGLDRATAIQGERARNVPATRSPGERSHPEREVVDTGRREVAGEQLKSTLGSRLQALYNKLNERSREAPPTEATNYGAGFNLDNNLPSPIRAMPDDLAAFLSDKQPDIAYERGEADVSRGMNASVITLSACQDTQTALDGDANGLFTGRLMRAWNNSQFAGDYDSFFRAIKGMLSGYPTHQPNKDYFGQMSTMFNKQKPFQI